MGSASESPRYRRTILNARFVSGHCLWCILACATHRVHARLVNQTFANLFDWERDMQRPLVLAALIGVGLFAITVFGQQTPPAAAPARPTFPPLGAAEKLADNLYRIPGAGGNSAVLVHDKGVLLVDTKVETNGQGILDAIKKVTDKPVTHIVNTHTHFDHTGSNAEFPASVEIVVQENTKTN